MVEKRKRKTLKVGDLFTVEDTQGRIRTYTYCGKLQNGKRLVYDANRRQEPPFDEKGFAEVSGLWIKTKRQVIIEQTGYPPAKHMANTLREHYQMEGETWDRN